MNTLKTVPINGNKPV